MLMNSSENFEIFEDIKHRIRAAQYKAVLGAIREQIMLYCHVLPILGLPARITRP